MQRNGVGREGKSRGGIDEWARPVTVVAVPLRRVWSRG